VKIVVGYPPYYSQKGTALCSQNRQFQWSKAGTVIYPVVLASAATVLKNKGNEVYWLDGIARGWATLQYLQELWKIKPDFIFWEVKTPIIQRVWLYISLINRNLPQTKVILCGDHVTALPDEIPDPFCTYQIKKGGDYDNKKAPLIDRQLTRWKDYAYRNGNFKATPGGYTMFARDCWHRKGGGCTFCSWTNLYRDFSVMSTENAMAEVESLAGSGCKEIFDDSGTFPVGSWLHDFCEKKRRMKNGPSMGCNMRSGVLQREDWRALRNAGFRLVLLGLESANDATLQKLNKGYTVGDIETSCRDASRAGLDVHVTSMVGFPWERKEDAEKTIRLCRSLFAKGWIQSMQATICIPYPGTALFKKAKEKNWLKTEDWSRYDMSGPILRCPIPDAELMAMVRDAYKTALTPMSIIRSTLRDPWDTMRKGKYLLSHLKNKTTGE